MSLGGKTMRTLMTLALITACPALAASDYVEERKLELDARGIGAVVIETGAGSLEVRGVAGLEEIQVAAIIEIAGRDEDRARRRIASDLVLTLEQEGEQAILRGYFDNGSWSFGDNGSVHLVVSVPDQVGLAIDDGSGPIVVKNVRGDITVEDGSGPIEMSDVGGNLTIEDGSGSISVHSVGGDVSIDDGSGSITVRDVAGSVTVDDGSGGIDIRNVDKDLIIENDGSGGLDFSDIRGRVTKDS